MQNDKPLISDDKEQAQQEDAFSAKLRLADGLGGLKEESRRKKYLSIFLSVFIAIGLWFYVMNSENPTVSKTFTGVTVEFLNVNVLEENGLTLSNVEKSKIKVKLEGQRSRLMSIGYADIVATVDVSGYSEGDNYVDVNVHVPSSVSVSEINPAQIRLSIEQMTTEDRDVQVRFTGSVPEDMEAAYIDLSTEIVAISGAKSVVAQVHHLSAELSCDMLSEETGTFVVDLVPVDSVGNEVADVDVSVDEVTITAQLYAVRTVDLNVETIGSLPDNLELSGIEAPSTVKIAGPADEINSINEISSQQIDLSEITSSKEIDLIPDVEGNVKLASSQAKVKVRITVRKRESRTFSYSADKIKLTGVPEGMTVKIDDETVSITINGTEAALDAISSSDFEMWIDCSGMNEDTAEATVNVELSDLALKSGITVSSAATNVTVSVNG